MNVYFDRAALKSGALTFPLVVLAAVAPFLSNLSGATPRRYDGAALSFFALAGILLLGLAALSFFNAWEFFFLRRAPALILQPNELYVRRVGRRAMTEIRYSDIRQFYIQEWQGRSGTVSHFLIIEITDRPRLKISCDNLDIRPQTCSRLSCGRHLKSPIKASMASSASAPEEHMENNYIDDARRIS